MADIENKDSDSLVKKWFALMQNVMLPKTDTWYSWSFKYKATAVGG